MNAKEISLSAFARIFFRCGLYSTLEWGSVYLILFDVCLLYFIGGLKKPKLSIRLHPQQT